MTRTLAGRTILVTRPAEQADALVRALERRGARVLVAPTIRLVPARSAALTLALKELAAGRSTGSCSRAQHRRDAARAPRLAARRARQGRGDRRRDRASAFRAWARRRPDLIPDVHDRGARASVPARPGPRALCPRADIAPEGIEDALERKGWRPSASMPTGRSSPPRSRASARDAFRRGDVDAVTFTSASTVRGFVGALGAGRGTPKVVCIGPVTAAAGARPRVCGRPPSPSHTRSRASWLRLERALWRDLGRGTLWPVSFPDSTGRAACAARPRSAR